MPQNGKILNLVLLLFTGLVMRFFNMIFMMYRWSPSILIIFCFRFPPTSLKLVCTCLRNILLVHGPTHKIFTNLSPILVDQLRIFFRIFCLFYLFNFTHHIVIIWRHLEIMWWNMYSSYNYWNLMCLNINIYWFQVKQAFYLIEL